MDDLTKFLGGSAKNADSAAKSADSAAKNADSAAKNAKDAGDDADAAGKNGGMAAREADDAAKAADDAKDAAKDTAGKVSVRVENNVVYADDLDASYKDKTATLRFFSDDKDICKEEKKASPPSMKMKLKKCDFDAYKGKTVDAELSVDGNVVAKGKIDIDQKGKANGEFTAVGGKEDKGAAGKKKGKGKPVSELPGTDAGYARRALFSTGVACTGIGAALGLYLVRRRRSAAVADRPHSLAK